jgi:biotin carboxylase
MSMPQEKATVLSQRASPVWTRVLAVGEQIGYPVLVKAAKGGGGKGMKLAMCAAELMVIAHILLVCSTVL